MDTSQLNPSPAFTSKPIKKKNSLRIDSSPYQEIFHRRVTLKHKTQLNQTLKLNPIETKKNDQRTIFKAPKEKKNSFTINYKDRYETSETAKHLTSKLAYLLSLKTPESTVFTIYTEIYHELANYLDDFKDLLEILRKGLAISAIKEHESSDFEFKNELDKSITSFGELLDKERKEKIGLINKLNILSDENNDLSQRLEKVLTKYNEYDKIIHSNPSKFIDAEKLLEKMLKQCEIIKKQQNYIQELKYNELKLNKTLAECEKRGINLSDIMNEEKDSVMNPTVNKILKKAQTLQVKLQKKEDE